jgi:hypothetical protein
LPPETIVKYELTECHFLELLVEKINDQEVYPGKEQMSVKWWPEEKMKLAFVLKYIAP